MSGYRVEVASYCKEYTRLTSVWLRYRIVVFAITLLPSFLVIYGYMLEQNITVAGMARAILWEILYQWGVWHGDDG